MSVCMYVCVQNNVAKLLGRFEKFFFQMVGMVQDSVTKNTKYFQVHPISSNRPISNQLARYQYQYNMNKNQNQNQSYRIMQSIRNDEDIISHLIQ